MPDTYYDIEDRIHEAIDTIPRDQKPNIAKLAREFNVPEQRLRQRWKGRLSKQDRIPSNRALSTAQELAVCQYLDQMDQGGLKARRKSVAITANTIFKQNHSGRTPAPTVLNAWSLRFLR